MAKDAVILAAIQVEIAVVGQVADGICIGAGFIGNPQCIVLRQLVGNTHLEIARKAAIPVRAEIAQYQLPFLLLCAPQLAVKAPAAAVKAVGLTRPVICLQLIIHAIYSNPGMLDAVGVASYDGTHVKGFGFVACGIVKASHNILHFAIFVRHQEALESRTVGNDAGTGAAAIFQPVEINHAAVLQPAKFRFCDFCHKESPLLPLMSKKSPTLTIPRGRQGSQKK